MTRVRVLFTRTFWLDAVERAAKTAAQCAASFFTVSTVVPAVSADWGTIGLSAGLGAGYSLLTSIASAPAPGMSPASLIPPGAG